MMTRNQVETSRNRREQIATIDRKKDIRSWLMRAVSAAFNFRTERACAEPNYVLARTAVTSADGAPSSSAPSANVWDLSGFWGLHGYYKITAGSGPIDLQLWAQGSTEGTANDWFLVEELSNVAENAEFHFDGKVRGRRVFLRVSDLQSVTNLSLYCTAE